MKTYYLSGYPMSLSEFDAILRKKNWSRSGTKAQSLTDPDKKLTNICQTCASDNKNHVLFEVDVNLDITEILRADFFIHRDREKFDKLMGLSEPETEIPSGSQIAA